MHAKLPRRETRTITAASEGCLLLAQYRPFAIPKPKNRKTEKRVPPVALAKMATGGGWAAASQIRFISSISTPFSFIDFVVIAD
jgi:hypothetical protein